MDEQRPWHRMFGLTWMDFFTGLPVTVEMEKDLSVKKQLLDVLLIRKEAEFLNCRLPDGFEDLARFNLVTFKSHMEKLSLWTLQELVGHYVNLRKQVSPSMDEDELLPEEQFRLYAVSARYPQQLASQLGTALRPVMEGVYDVSGLGMTIPSWCPTSCAKRSTTLCCTCSAREANCWSMEASTTTYTPPTPAP
jgi:hypothetical protein